MSGQARFYPQIQQWEALYNTGKRLRLAAAHIDGAFAEAWARAPELAGAVEIYGITLCGIGIATGEPDNESEPVPGKAAR